MYTTQCTKKIKRSTTCNSRNTDLNQYDTLNEYAKR